LPIVDLRQKTNEGRDAQDIVDSRHCGCYGDLHDIDDSDLFLAFTRNITTRDQSKEFKPVSVTKYNRKQDARQLIHLYSTTIEVSGSSNTTKVVYFPMALEFAPLT
jgi:hypothetical protein